MMLKYEKVVKKHLLGIYERSVCLLGHTTNTATHYGCNVYSGICCALFHADYEFSRVLFHIQKKLQAADCRRIKKAHPDKPDELFY